METDKYKELAAYKDWLVENYEDLKDGFDIRDYGTCLMGIYDKIYLPGHVTGDNDLFPQLDRLTWKFLCSSHWWYCDDNTLKGAIQRMEYLLEVGVPDTLTGKTSESFRETQKFLDKYHTIAKLKRSLKKTENWK